MLGIKRIQSNFRFIGALALVFAVFSSLLISPHLFAQSANSASNPANTIKVTPVRTDTQIMPGDSKTIQVTVTNLTKAPISVTPVINDFVAGDDRGTPALILDVDKFAPSHSLKRFMAPLTTATIPGNQSKTFDVVITVPSDAQAGGYFGAVRFAPTDPSSGGQVNLSASVASLVLLTVPGDVIEKLRLDDFEIQQNGVMGTSFRTPDSLKAAFAFQNQGNLQIGPFGKISVKKGDKVVYSTDFNGEDPRDVILPDSTRRWEVPLKDIDSFGRFEVVATFTYGTTNQTIEVTKSFWVIPTWVIIAAIVGVVLLIGAIILTIILVRRSHKRRHMPKIRRR